MENVLVTGADGFIGRRFCSYLAEHGHCVRRAVRRCSSWRSNAGVDLTGLGIVEVGDIDGSTNWCNALRDVDVIVHLAARVHVMREMARDPLKSFREVNVDGTKQLAAAAGDAGVKRIVYISSIKVNGECTSRRPFTEDDDPAPQDAYGISKMEAEQVLIEQGRRIGYEYVIIRPTLVYGPGVGGNFARITNSSKYQLLCIYYSQPPVSTVLIVTRAAHTKENGAQLNRSAVGGQYQFRTAILTS